MNPQLALLLALVASAALSAVSGSFNPYYIQVLTFAGINIILGVSLNLINGHTGQFSLGHAGFMAVGGYASAFLTTKFGPQLAGSFLGENALFLGALIAGGVAAALAGLTVGVPSLRLKGDYLAIITLGFGEIIRVLIQNTDAVGGPRGLTGIPGYTNLFWTFGLAAVTIYVISALVDSTYGRGFLTVRDDEIAASAMGIDTTRYKVVAFIVGAFFAGVAGGLFAHSTRYLTPEGFTFQKTVEIVIIVILGGMGHNAGVAFAAVLVTILLEALRGVADLNWLPQFVRDLTKNRTLIFSVVLIALMLLRPQGLFGGLKIGKAKAT
ncbi:MAG: branched-chain amino acid ABC transporter permease [Verrucomicrobia bacterium]|nr:branched-chain amino acid ABC transporter permease [Verrucomicrobiota bacterium]